METAYEEEANELKYVNEVEEAEDVQEAEKW